ncbi:MAG TPA: hypothetical protein VF116_06590 [Ktedonobacterales bacterium]
MSDRQARYMITLKDGRELPAEAHYSRLASTGAEGDCTSPTLGVATFAIAQLLARPLPVVTQT